VRFEPRSGETWRDPFGMYRALRDHDPVHHVAAPASDGTDYWVLSRFEDVFAAARDTAAFSSAEGLTFTYGEREKLAMGFAPMVMLDPPDHTRFRRLVSHGFTPRKVSTLESDVRGFAADRIERLRSAGGGDLIAELGKPVPSFVVAGYLGVPEIDRAEFDQWTEAIVGASASGDVLRASGAVAELAAYFDALVQRRRGDPADDMVTALVDAERDGSSVPPLEIIGFAFTMVTGGNDTVTGFVGGAAELLARCPDFTVDVDAGTYAEGHFVRRHTSLPFDPG
jgi:hypothetical protein